MIDNIKALVDGIKSLNFLGKLFMTVIIIVLVTLFVGLVAAAVYHFGWVAVLLAAIAWAMASMIEHKAGTDDEPYPSKESH